MQSASDCFQTYTERFVEFGRIDVRVGPTPCSTAAAVAVRKVLKGITTEKHSAAVVLLITN